MEEKLFVIEDGVLTQYTGNKKDVVIPEGVSEIGFMAFERCTSLESVIIPKGVRTIKRNAFSRCSSLESVVIPEGVMTIDNWAFVDCASLKAVTIPGSVRHIGYGAFERCSSLTSADISDGVAIIGGRAFAGCTSLESVSIPASVMEIDRYWTEFDDMLAGEQRNSPYPFDLFDGCTSIKEIRYGGTKAQWLFMLGGFNLVSPVRVAVSCSDGDARSVRSDLLKRRKVTEIALPGNIVKIASRAFAGCESLASVKIPGSVVMICSEAFKGCASLCSVEYDDTMEEWERVEGKENLLSYIPATDVKCSDGVWVRPSVLVEHETLVTCLDKDAASVTVPAGVTEIAGRVSAGLKKIFGGAFEDCTSLTSVSIPAGVRKIGWKAFEGCTSLKEIRYGGTKEQWAAMEKDSDLCSNIPAGKIICTDGVFTKEDEIEHDDSNLKKFIDEEGRLILPEGVPEIGWDAFHNCEKLTSVTIPGSVESIGYRAFSGCTKLTSVSIPGNVKNIDLMAFEGCTSLKSVSFSEGVSRIDWGAFRDCTSLTSVKIPGSVVMIGDEAFKGCTSLTSVSIAEGAISIDSGAFYGCTSLTSVSIPGSITSIGKRAFSKCTSLNEIQYGGTKNLWLFELAGFSSVPRNIVIHCTDGDAKPVSRKITEIVIPGDVKGISCDAFKGYRMLTSVGYAGTMEEWEAVAGKTNLLSCIPVAEVKCADGVWKLPAILVERGTLVKCLDKNAVRVTVPDGVTEIDWAFYGCTSLKTVSIPASVRHIGYGAFEGCSSLREISFGGTKAQWNNICKEMLSNSGLYAQEDLKNMRDVWKLTDMPDAVIQCADGTLERT